MGTDLKGTKTAATQHGFLPAKAKRQTSIAFVYSGGAVELKRYRLSTRSVGTVHYSRK